MDEASQMGMIAIRPFTSHCSYRAVGFEIDALDLSLYTNTDTTDGEVAIFMKRRL